MKRGSGVLSASSSLSSTLACASRWRRRSASRIDLAVLVIGVADLRHGDVGIDPASLNRAARRRVIARSRQPERRFRTGLDNGLDRALAEALLAHDQRAAVILQRAGDDLRCRSRAGVGQHDHRQSVRHVAGPRIIALDIVLAAAALRDDLAAVEEVVGDVDRLVEQPARVGAEVDDIAQRLAAGGLVDRHQRRLGLRPRRCR